MTEMKPKKIWSESILDYHRKVVDGIINFAERQRLFDACILDKDARFYDGRDIGTIVTRPP